MRNYDVVAVRTTVYRVEAENAKDAIDKMINEPLKYEEKAATATNQIHAVPVCPTCATQLTMETTREYQDKDGETQEEPTYCGACDCEVDADE